MPSRRVTVLPAGLASFRLVSRSKDYTTLAYYIVFGISLLCPLRSTCERKDWRRWCFQGCLHFSQYLFLSRARCLPISTFTLQPLTTLLVACRTLDVEWDEVDWKFYLTRVISLYIFHLYYNNFNYIYFQTPNLFLLHVRTYCSPAVGANT